MSAVTSTLTEYRFQLRNNRLGLWLFFISEVFLFGGLLVARFYLWGNTRPNLDQALGLVITSILLLSSFFMNRAETAIAHDDRRTFLESLIVTALLGVIFLIGVVGFEWGGHIKPSDGAFGIVFILIVWNLGRKGNYSAERHWGVEACAMYWHYVDLVWVFFYPALYLIGTAT
jgi:cytochrome c oxidase subunit 3